MERSEWKGGGEEKAEAAPNYAVPGAGQTFN